MDWQGGLTAFGLLLSRLVSERWLSLAGGVLFLVMGGLVLAGVF